MLQDLCKSFQRGFLRDSVHAKADFLIFLSPKCLLIGHDNENHYRSIQRKLQPKIEFDYTEKQNALDLIRQQKPMMVVVSDIAHYLFMGEPLLEIIEWVHQLQELVLSVFFVD
jgi:hypothetical protein